MKRIQLLFLNLFLIFTVNNSANCSSESPDTTDSSPVEVQHSDTGPDTVSDDAQTKDILSLTDAQIMGGDCNEAPPIGVARVRSACNEAQPTLPYASEAEGDLVLESSKARFVIRAAGPHGLMLLGTGSGGLVDAMPAVDGQFQPSLDRLQELIPFPGLRSLKDPTFTYATGTPGEAAFVHVEGELAPIPIADSVFPGMGVQGIAEITWSLLPDSSVLDVEIKITPDEANKVTPIVWMGMLYSGFLDGWTDENGVSGEPGGTGQLYAGISPEVSLGVYAPKGLSFVDAGGLVLAMVTGESNGPKETATAGLQFTVVPGELDALRASLGLNSTTVQEFNLEGPIPFDDSPIIVEAIDDDERVHNRMVTHQAGIYSLEMPESTNKLRVRWQHGPVGEAVNATPGETLTLKAPTVARISLEAKEFGTDQSIPARVILQNELGKETLQVIGPQGPTNRLVVPGQYAILFTRGHEYEASFHEEINAEDGQTVSIVGELQRVIDTSGWIACDFHLHSDFSTDSADPLRQRILEVAAEGVEFAVSTDHDFVVDYAPLRDSQGLAPFLQVTQGVEMSNPKLNHASSFPWDVKPLQSGQGAPSWHTLVPHDLFTLLGMDDPSRIFQMNHPRGSTGYHNSIKYNPVTGESEQSPNTLGLPSDTQLSGFKYDALEIYNGKRTEDIPEVFEDWLSLLAQGIHIAGTGTSDSHQSGSYPGAARTYVWIGEGLDDPSTIQEKDLREGVLSGQTLVVGGPFVEAWLLPLDEENGTPSRVGQVQHATGTTAQLRVRIQAPSWMPVDEIEIWKNQELALSQSIGAPNAESQIVRLDQSFDISVEQDSFFVVVAKSSSVPRPYLKDQIISFAGPLFLNMDGDESYTAPGLLEPEP